MNIYHTKIINRDDPNNNIFVEGPQIAHNSREEAQAWADKLAVVIDDSEPVTPCPSVPPEFAE